MPPGTLPLARSLRAVALLVLCLASAPSQTEGQTIQQGSPISIDPEAAPDSAILDRVEAILEAIAAYQGVEAQVRAGVVRLDGEVAREADAEALAQLVGRIEGVAAVSNGVEATRDVALRLAPVVERLRLTSRATVLMTLDGDHLRIPNATVFKGKIRNYTLHPERRFTFDLGLDPAADLAAARRTGLDAMAALDFTLAAPPPNAWVDQSRTDFLQARGEAIRVTKAAPEAADFALPEPSYRLLMTDLAAQDPDDGRRPSATLAPTPAAAARMAVQANAADRDETIERRVEQERRDVDGGDLLRADARTE